MLRYALLHPPLLAALAASGHGGRILIADANYAHSTNANPRAPIIHLNLRPGMVTADDVLATLLDAAPVESAFTMRPDDGSDAPMRARFAELLGPDVPVSALARADFYAACLGPELAATVATGDQRHYANILLTLGSRPADAS
ncbi:RbsD/FucU domain-containing protein [Actinocorallia sp. A-T 12471]|uniref:RbsD/FucU domain-containing protein n=1 Tax=Actinocorallia sp. A-T 12471 TaxID=3089813 RepID=UPI0029D1E0AB|nr:RbsD/FucU domain-containing protein [Actinocorallia sp. A-T 12471]MDX6741137.1 RbsD/FucU domain-containing protein [Actinocorallia sp. A-T 12471]